MKNYLLLAVGIVLFTGGTAFSQDYPEKGATEDDNTVVKVQSKEYEGKEDVKEKETNAETKEQVETPKIEKVETDSTWEPVESTEADSDTTVKPDNLEHNNGVLEEGRESREE